MMVVILGCVQQTTMVSCVRISQSFMWKRNWETMMWHCVDKIVINLYLETATLCMFKQKHYTTNEEKNVSPVICEFNCLSIYK